MFTDKPYHIPVLVTEVLHFLAPKPHGVYIDVTFGGGGHTTAILESEPTCRIIAFDWDKKALELNAPALEERYGKRLEVHWGSFVHLKNNLKKMGIKKVDGILADFGTSQYQIFQEEGFSFSIDSPLDMRMSPAHTPLTAYDVINKAPEEQLADIFFTLGGERSSRKVARFIATERTKTPIVSTAQLAALVMRVIPRYSRTIHPATKVFQALRIFVNDELNNIKSFLAQSLDLLNPLGRIVCISFHSGEDRLVKQFFKEHTDKLSILTKKIIIASDEESSSNPSSRSAKLRAAELKDIS
ncbi:16S rRNA (cytosine(1402)-N(4))-methyltransferase RsmH [Candidatus Dependentiae bacterium]|nr:16S rRNA (cytosine(1402)-N(4))-methyltransferase RsmH [Candidatus Dependentiae bacterium]